jgi:hypothetical protein
MGRRVVLESGPLRSEHKVTNARELDEAVAQMKIWLATSSRYQFCASLTISVHLEGEGCDHE